MSRGLNKCMFIGNLGRDPELKSTDTFEVCNFSIAIDESYTKDGSKVEKTEWVNIVAFGKLADICEKYLQKGSKVYIEGNMSTRKYTDKEGVEKYSTSIKASHMVMLGGKGSDTEGAPVAKQGSFEDAVGDDDVPF